MRRPRLTNAELRALRDMLFLKQEGHYDSKTHRWVYDTDLYKKLNRILQSRKGNQQ